jgi:hypothetical protein
MAWHAIGVLNWYVHDAMKQISNCLIAFKLLLPMQPGSSVVRNEPEDWVLREPKSWFVHFQSLLLLNILPS